MATAPAKRIGRPLDMDLRDRIFATRQAHPDWSLSQIAAELKCARRIVARIVDPLPRRRGERVVVPALLAARAAKRGGILAVLEAALAESPGTPSI